MTKYDKAFKLKIVRLCQRGPGGYKVVARAHGLGPSSVRRWVASYRIHGPAGLTMKVGHYDVPFKLNVLRRIRRDSLSLQQASVIFDIRSADRIALWQRQYHAGGVDALASKPLGRPKAMAAPKPPKLGALKVPDENRSQKDLLKELEYLRAENAYLKKLDALIQEKKAAAQKKRS